MALNISLEMVTQECCNCGTIWQMTKAFDDNRRETKATFYCPNGHGQSYTMSKAQVLEGKLLAKDVELNKMRNEKERLEREVLYAARHAKKKKPKTKKV